MLIIYGCMRVGGIETFFLRLAKFSKKKGVTLKFLLLSERSDSNEKLIRELMSYADVYFYHDIFIKNSLMSNNFFLLNPINIVNLNAFLENVKIIHVTTAQHALLVNRFLKLTRLEIPMTVGVYHSQEFCWDMWKIPYFERIHRNYIFEYISDKNILCFSEATRQFMVDKAKYPLVYAKTFRLGVVDKVLNKVVQKEEFRGRVIRICAVGRLVKFKTYNIWMIDVIRNLKDKKIDIVFDIYGDGPLVKDINLNKGDLNINLKGSFDYSDFNNVVCNYDLFIGSGTAIVQAASLGVPSIIGIESIKEPYTYGFFSDFYKYEYHNSDLHFKKNKVEDLILDFYSMSIDEKRLLSMAHVSASNSFTMDECFNGFFNPEIPYVKTNKLIDFNVFLYFTSKICFYIYCRIFGKDIYYKG